MRGLSRVAIAAAVAGVVAVVLAGCSGEEDAADAPGEEQTVVADDVATDQAGAADDEGSGGGGLEELYADAFAGQFDPEPTWEIGDMVLEFTFSSGSVETDPSLHCAVASGAFSGDLPDWDTEVTYPDGSALCSEVTA